MSTERLYYTDSYLVRFRAAIVERSGSGRRVYLNRTAFYPASGGQPHDTGRIAGAPVLEVVEEGEWIAHVTGSPVEEVEVECRIDWPRRFDHMQQHSGQHLLSAVLLDLCGAQTLGFHLGAESSTIDVGVPSLDPAQIAAAEQRANEIAFENRPVAVSFEEPSADLALRKPSERAGVLRIVSIAGLDRSACGGTHVRATGEIGPILVRKIDRAHGKVRLEFLCGLRAVARARGDFEALAKIARTFSAPADDTPALVAAQNEALDATEKARRKLAAELARYKGRELYEATETNAAGMRVALRRIAKGALDEELRGTAQGFTAAAKAVFLAVIDDPPALLLACSADTGIHAGEALKSAVTKPGGRGGGNAQLAQGSVPSPAALEQAAQELLANIR